MINEVTIEGIVTREPWTYDKDVFFRIASYRDMDMPAKPDTIVSGRDEPDYTNIRYPGGAVFFAMENEPTLTLKTSPFGKLKD